MILVASVHITVFEYSEADSFGVCYNMLSMPGTWPPAPHQRMPSVTSPLSPLLAYSQRSGSVTTAVYLPALMQV